MDIHHYKALLEALETNREQTIEAIMDHIGLPDMLLAMAAICKKNETHIRESWHDETLATRWQHAHGHLSICAHRQAITELPR